MTVTRRSEKMTLKLSPLLDSFIEKVKEEMENEVDKPVPKSEVIRRLLWFIADLRAMPDVSLGPLAQKAASFERVFRKLSKETEEGDQKPRSTTSSDED